MSQDLTNIYLHFLGRRWILRPINSGQFSTKNLLQKLGPAGKGSIPRAGIPSVRKKGSSGTNDLAVIGVTRQKTTPETRYEPEKPVCFLNGETWNGVLGDFGDAFVGEYFLGWTMFVFGLCVIHCNLWGIYLTIYSYVELLVRII